jgi:hypothetical protein
LSVKPFAPVNVVDLCVFAEQQHSDFSRGGKQTNIARPQTCRFRGDEDIEARAAPSTLELFGQSLRMDGLPMTPHSHWKRLAIWFFVVALARFISSLRSRSEKRRG